MIFKNLILIPILISFIIAFTITPLVIKLMWKIGIIDDPQKNKHPKVIHKNPTPRGGGLAIYISILLTTIFVIPLDKHLLAILTSITILLIMGIFDDKYNLNPYLRLFIQFFVALIPIASGIGIAFISNPLGKGIIDLSYPRLEFFLLGETRSIWILSDLFAVFWIVALMNFINMGVKGLPGQLSGVSAIAAIVIALLSFKYSADITEWPVTILASITAGAFLGFLPFHMWPQKIMPSFSGSNIAGFMLAVLAILTTAKVGTLLVILAVPIIDTGYAIIRRILQGKSPVWGDRGHLHHKLMDEYKMTKNQVTYFYWGITFLFGMLSLQLSAENKFYTIIGIAILLAGFILWTTYRKTKYIK